MFYVVYSTGKDSSRLLLTIAPPPPAIPMMFGDCQLQELQEDTVATAGEEEIAGDRVPAEIAVMTSASVFSAILTHGEHDDGYYTAAEGQCCVCCVR